MCLIYGDLMAYECNNYTNHSRAVIGQRKSYSHTHIHSFKSVMHTKSLCGSEEIKKCIFFTAKECVGAKIRAKM